MEALLCRHESNQLSRRTPDAGEESWSGVRSTLAGTAGERNVTAALQMLDEKEGKTKKKGAKNLQLDANLATIAHLYSKTTKMPNGQRSEYLYKRDFWRLFGQAILHRKQEDGGRPIMASRAQTQSLREMTDDMFDVLDVSRKGYLEVEDFLRFVNPSATEEKKLCMSRLIREEAGLALKKEQIVDQVVLPNITADQAEEIKSIYDLYDEEHTGRITQEMFYAGLEKTWEQTPDNLDRAYYWNQLDPRDRGFVTQVDFINWLQDVMFVLFEDLNKGYVDELKPYVSTPRKAPVKNWHHNQSFSRSRNSGNRDAASRPPVQQRVDAPSRSRTISVSSSRVPSVAASSPSSTHPEETSPSPQRILNRTPSTKQVLAAKSKGPGVRSSGVSASSDVEKDAKQRPSTKGGRLQMNESLLGSRPGSNTGQRPRTSG